MKNLIASLALAMLVTGTSFAADHTADDKKEKAVMQTAIYPSAGSTKLNVVVANGTNRSVAVRLLDQKGEMLASQFMGKASKPTKARFDISALEDGVYLVEITNGETKEIKQLTLKTSQPEVASYRSIAMN
ncbi:T9SS type A sorting domain-containing protein [Tellurirhabdus rosea]|uniref:T9SS type A sorting domain-containing protein n=1 Tax=Tellurirhabdus rosea TaxID=2674997 RepID=UPI00225437F1|nr:T9SS type A sorting domain-containing protein [Tellurirhabdus rosea]